MWGAVRESPHQLLCSLTSPYWVLPARDRVLGQFGDSEAFQKAIALVKEL